MAEARVLTWNLERKKPSTPTGRAGVDLLHSLDPDVMVLTEARTCFPPRGGHLVGCRPMPYRHLEADERRVVLWSKNPWEDIDDVGVEQMPVGRFVSGCTDTPIGRVRVVGVCIPWHMSNVSVGDRNRTPWEDHLTFLSLLPKVLSEYAEPTVVAGDFNQRVPSTGGRRDVAAALASCFDGHDIVTAGQVVGVAAPLIDHVALGPGLAAHRISGWLNDHGGVRMSDHGGVGVDVGLRV